MKKPHHLILCLTLSLGFLGCQKDVETVEENSDQAEKPIQHLKLEDIVTESSAVEVMQSTTEQLRAKTNLDALELHEIHMITYSLEKAVAFFAENLSGARQVTAQEMAIAVEEVHLSSENNRKDATKAALDQYFALFESFTKGS
jgi:PBP1b-binding outer membrane lipoprotein LpoB